MCTQSSRSRSRRFCVRPPVCQGIVFLVFIIARVGVHILQFFACQPLLIKLLFDIPLWRRREQLTGTRIAITIKSRVYLALIYSRVFIRKGVAAAQLGLKLPGII